ncbi:MAG: hypothetical protein IT428_29190 [Planctomycetaceae bacterium]|nr:hypothetical protein [Planctomycetaceae bacterium]
MTTPRRRVLRPERVAESRDRSPRLIARRQAQLERERDGFERWMTRLRRAANEVARRQKRIVRLERTLARLQAE